MKDMDNILEITVSKERGTELGMNGTGPEILNALFNAIHAIHSSLYHRNPLSAALYHATFTAMMKHDGCGVWDPPAEDQGFTVDMTDMNRILTAMADWKKLAKQAMEELDDE